MKNMKQLSIKTILLGASVAFMSHMAMAAPITNKTLAAVSSYNTPHSATFSAHAYQSVEGKTYMIPTDKIYNDIKVSVSNDQLYMGQSGVYDIDASIGLKVYDQAVGDKVEACIEVNEKCIPASYNELAHSLVKGWDIRSLHLKGIRLDHGDTFKVSIGDSKPVGRVALYYLSIKKVDVNPN